MTIADEEQRRMMKYAKARFGGDMLAILAGFPASRQIDMLIELSCTLACMTYAIERTSSEKLSETSGLFYEGAGRLASSLLLDVVAEGRQ